MLHCCQAQDDVKPGRLNCRRDAGVCVAPDRQRVRPERVCQVGLDKVTVDPRQVFGGFPAQLEQGLISVNSCVAGGYSLVRQQPGETAVAATNVQYSQLLLSEGSEMR